MQTRDTPAQLTYRYRLTESHGLTFPPGLAFVRPAPEARRAGSAPRPAIDLPLVWPRKPWQRPRTDPTIGTFPANRPVRTPGPPDARQGCPRRSDRPPASRAASQATVSRRGAGSRWTRPASRTPDIPLRCPRPSRGADAVGLFTSSGHDDATVERRSGRPKSFAKMLACCVFSPPVAKTHDRSERALAR